MTALLEVDHDAVARRVLITSSEFLGRLRVGQPVLKLDQRLNDRVPAEEVGIETVNRNVDSNSPSTADHGIGHDRSGND